MFYVKYHKENVIAICDEELIGKHFEEGRLVLDVSESFYKGELKNKDEIRLILKNDKNFNLVGKEIIKIAVKEKVVDKNAILVIGGVLHAQVY